MLEQVARLRGAGRTVVVSILHPDHAVRVADRVVLMTEDAILADDTPTAALTAGRLETVYGIPVTVAQVDTDAGRRWCCRPAQK